VAYPAEIDPADGNTVGTALPNNESAPGEARSVVRKALAGWRLPSLVDSCVLAVSELVTNALKHGLPPVSLLVRRRRNDVRIDVGDARPEPLDTGRHPVADELAEFGRGLDILRQVSDEVGSEHVPGDGKNVFATWKVADAPRDELTAP
jgi:anti-sigma regulatory factor (Ser/Thr protein kinase)